MLVGSKNYRTIEASEDRSYVKIIDQTLLPFKFKIIHLKTLDEVVRAIKNMQVRGAPLIGVTAAYGFALSMDGGPGCERVDGVRGMRGGSILGGGGDELRGVSGGGGGCGQRSVDGVCVVWGWLSFGGGCVELQAVPGWVG